MSTTLTLRVDERVPARLAQSVRTRQGVGTATARIPDWLAAYRRHQGFHVERIRFDELDHWSFAAGSGNLVHDSGRFFSIEGLRVELAGDACRQWQQPVIVQPEVGILGLLAREFDGVLHVLMQAKMEPGNPNLIQLSPTVQATRSNYTRVHRGAPVPYLEYFTGGRHRVLADVLQSEQGAWSLHKVNRNMIVETRDPVPVHDGFCWLTLGQLGELLRHDNLVNMDARSVLACVPSWAGEPRARSSDTALRSWFTTERTRHEVHTRRIPLDEVAHWHRGPDAIAHRDGRYFRVVAVRAGGRGREVASWSQPLIEPVQRGVAAFLLRHFDGVPHLLAHARVESGFIHVAELGPTVQHTPANYAHLAPADRPPFLDAVLTVPRERIRYEAVHSEEGGRYLHAESRYLLIEADEAMAPDHPPPGYRWVTPGQLTTLVRHSHYVNVQARTLLAVLHTTRP